MIQIDNISRLFEPASEDFWSNSQNSEFTAELHAGMYILSSKYISKLTIKPHVFGKFGFKWTIKKP